MIFIAIIERIKLPTHIANCTEIRASQIVVVVNIKQNGIAGCTELVVHHRRLLQAM